MARTAHLTLRQLRPGDRFSLLRTMQRCMLLQRDSFPRFTVLQER